MSNESTRQDYTNVQRFGTHIAKNGKTYVVYTGYAQHRLCSFVKPHLPLIDSEFIHVHAIMTQALHDRSAKQYFDTYETPKPTIYD